MGRAGSKDPNRRNGTQVLILEFIGLFLDPLRIQNLCAGSGSSRPGSYDTGGTGSRRPFVTIQVTPALAAGTGKEILEVLELLGSW